MNPRSTSRAAPAAPAPPPPGAAPPGAAAPGAAPAELPFPAPAPAPVEQPAPRDQGAHHWRFTFGVAAGELVVNVHSSNKQNSGAAAPFNVAPLGAAIARMVAGFLAHDPDAMATAGSDFTTLPPDLLDHVHIGIHWKPAKPVVQPTAAPSGKPLEPEKPLEKPAASS